MKREAKKTAVDHIYVSMKTDKLLIN